MSCTGRHPVRRPHVIDVCDTPTPSLVGWILCHTVFCPVLFVLYLNRVTISPHFRDTQKDKTTTHCLRERPHLQYLLCLKNTQ